MVFEGQQVKLDGEDCVCAPNYWTLPEELLTALGDDRYWLHEWNLRFLISLPMSYRFVRYEPKYLEDVLELQTHLWSPSTQVNAEYFAWKYEQNPYLDEVLIYLLLKDERVVGMRGLSGARWCADDAQSFVVPCAGDTVIAPDHRRKGLMREIFRYIANDCKLAEFPYLLNFSAGEAVYFCQLKEGWHTVGHYETAIRSHKYLNKPMLRGSWWLARRILGKSIRRTLLRTAIRMTDRSSRDNPIHISSSEHPRPVDMARLVKLMNRPGKICHVRDETYFTWRFRSPLSRYRFYYCKDDSLKGFLVTQQNKCSAGSPINIVEWEGTNQDIIGELLIAAIGDAGIGRLALWTATLPDSFYELLHKHSFEESEGDAEPPAFLPSLMVTCLNKSRLKSEAFPTIEIFGNIDQWDLRMIYSDMH